MNEYFIMGFEKAAADDDRYSKKMIGLGGAAGGIGGAAIGDAIASRGSQDRAWDTIKKQYMKFRKNNPKTVKMNIPYGDSMGSVALKGKKLGVSSGYLDHLVRKQLSKGRLLGGALGLASGIGGMMYLNSKKDKKKN